MRLVYKALEIPGVAFLLGLPGGLRIWRVDSIFFVCVLEKAFCEGRIKQLEPYFLKGGKQMRDSSSFKKACAAFLLRENSFYTFVDELGLLRRS